MVDVRLTQEVRDIVYKFYSSNRNVFASADDNLRLAASLYAFKHLKGMNVNEWLNIYHTDITLEFEVIENLKDYVVDLNKFLSESEIVILMKNYADVIEYCFSIYKQQIQTSVCLNSQPEELTIFCSELLGMKEGSNVYNPFGGLGSFAIENPNCNFYGEEINNMIWNFMQIRLDAHNCKSKYMCKNSFEELETPTLNYDYVITNASYGMQEGKYSFYHIIKLAMENKLKEGGTLLIILPIYFCTALIYEKIRKYLIENGFLEVVISLPNLFAPVTMAKACVVIAKKEKHDEFTLIDGSKFISRDEGGNSLFSYTPLLKMINNRELNRISKDSLNEQLNLDPSSYFKKIPIRVNSKKLGELISLCDVFSYNSFAWMYNFKGVEWSNPVLMLDRQSIMSWSRCFELKGECLITRIGHGIPKTGVLKEPSKGRNIVTLYNYDFAYKIKRKDLILEAYLRLILESEYVIKQINAYFQKNVVRRLSVEEFLGITIYLPGIQHQERIVKDKLNNILQQAGVTNTYADLAHMLGTPFSKISGALSVIESSPNLSTIDKNAVKSIYANLGYVSRLLDMNMGLNTWGEKTEPVCLYDFVVSYLENWKLYGAQTFNIGVVCDEESKKLVVKGNKDALTIMFDCLLDNANRHGFHKKSNPGNKLVINIENTVLVYGEPEPNGNESIHRKLCVLLRVANNGTPIAENFDKSDYITKGRFDASSGRTGLGGYHVYSIVKSMDGDVVDIITDSGWTDFQFLIPVINN